MRLSEICVNRPVFAFMLIMFLVVMGVGSCLDLGVDWVPQSDPATIYVRLKLPGASPEEMVSQVVLPVEETVAAVSGIDELRAMVTEGNANVMVTYHFQVLYHIFQEEVEEGHQTKADRLQH